MATLGGAMGAVQSVVATLQSYLPAAIDAVWTQAGTTIGDGARTLTVTKVKPSAAQILTHDHYFPPEPQWVCVYANGGEYEPGQEQAWNLTRHGLTVAWGICGDHEAMLQEQVARWQQAIWWVLQEHKQLDGNFPGLYNVRPGKWQFTVLGAHPNRGGALCQRGMIQVTVEAAESAPF